MKTVVRWICVLGLAAAIVSGVKAQEATARVRGTVTDGSGAVVSGAQVTAIQTETGLQRNTVSDAQGAYVLLALPVGPLSPGSTGQRLQEIRPGRNFAWRQPDGDSGDPAWRWEQRRNWWK